MLQTTVQERNRQAATRTSDPGSWTSPGATDRARKAARARAASGRRRKVDPTTSERDYSIEELEFMAAMQEYKRRSGRMFPTWSEVLEVLRSLGYEKVEEPGQAS